MSLIFNAMRASVSGISGIPVLGHPPSWCTHKLTACFVSQSTALNRDRAGNFSDTTVAKWPCPRTLRKLKSVKTFLPSTRIVQITESNQDLV
jgi:hypothetical protein